MALVTCRYTPSSAHWGLPAFSSKFLNGRNRPDGDTGTRSDGAATAPSQPSDVHLLGDHKRVVDLDAEVSHSAFNLRMSQ
jgi:hypothetical protein